MCNKCQEDCESCRILAKKYGDNLSECPYCGHLYHGDFCTCTKGEALGSVIDEMKKRYGEMIVDYNVVGNDRVELLNSKEKVITTINSDELTEIWNLVE